MSSKNTSFLKFEGSSVSGSKLDLVGTYRGQRQIITFYKNREKKLRKIDIWFYDVIHVKIKNLSNFKCLLKTKIQSLLLVFYKYNLIFKQN